MAPETRDPDLVAQLELGAMVFSSICAECHGEQGEGTSSAPMLIGEGTLLGFATAESVFEFASTWMPYDAPGSLTSEEYLAVVAYVLTENEIAIEEPLTLSRAASISLCTSASSSNRSWS